MAGARGWVGMRTRTCDLIAPSAKSVHADMLVEMTKEDADYLVTASATLSA